jgi:predicted transcriptional regulator
MVTQLELPEEMAQRLDALARHVGQSREDLMRAVLADYLAHVAEDEARLEAAIAAADRGEVVDADEADAEMEAQLLAHGVTPEQLAAIRAEVFAEMESDYPRHS